MQRRASGPVAQGGGGDQPPWMDGWPSVEARRAYFRNYMRRWRWARRIRCGPRAEARNPRIRERDARRPPAQACELAHGPAVSQPLPRTSFE
jgi:hypothetical protein